MRLPVLSAALLLAACTAPPSRPQPVAAAADVPRTIAAAWSSPIPAQSVALASWTGEDGAVRVIVATPAGLALRDGDDGAVLAAPATQAVAAPSGAAVFGDHLFVAAADRVEVLSLPGFAPAGSFGEGQSGRAGALWIDERGPDELRVYVADVAEARIARFRVQFDDAGRLQARADGGAATAAAPLQLAGDPADARLLVADARGVHVLAPDGRAAARVLPAASGLALWTCPEGGGYWLLADPHGEVALYDRATLAPAGRFRDAMGRPLGALDLHAAGTPRFPAGVLYAAAGDALLAFDLRDIAAALELAPDCVQ
ncbi:MAG: hypothetical protein ACTHKZ_05650 [Lysobacteraceae bacterium]